MVFCAGVYAKLKSGSDTKLILIILSNGGSLLCVGTLYGERKVKARKWWGRARGRLNH